MKIAVIGGGASGMCAAISAARNRADVVIFDRNDTLGKKILVTGNGKCNLTNRNMSKDFYYSDNVDFITNVLDRFGFDETIRFFNGLGLLLLERRGLIYPNSEQASTVNDVLNSEIVSLNIRVINALVTDIRKIDSGFEVYSKEEILFFDRVIIATGGNAAPKTGSDGIGYKLAMNLGHSIIRPLPALTSLKCKGDFWKKINGVRTTAEIFLEVDEKIVASNIGELQITDYGISGIPVFQISRIAAKSLLEDKSTNVYIDFFPKIDSEHLFLEIASRVTLLGDRCAIQLLSGMINAKIASMVLDMCNLSDKGFISVSDIAGLINILKHFKCEIRRVNGFDNAQTTAGGVSLDDINSDFESKISSGLYFCGEILDVDGMCGGYNLQWAWSSGCLAGEAASLC